MAVTTEQWAMAIAWSFNAFLMFGFSNYLIGYTNSLGVDFSGVLGLIFFGSVMQPLVALPGMVAKHGTIFFPPEATKAKDDDYVELAGSVPESNISWWPKFMTFFGGVLVALAQVFMKLSMGADPVDSGPLCAVISSDVVFVGLFCHFVYGEKLSVKQFIAVLGVFIGTVTMALGGESAKSTTDESVGAAGMLVGLLWAVFASISFGGSVICIRIGGMGGLHPESAFTSRMLGIGVMGVMFFAYSIFSGGLQDTLLPLDQYYSLWVLCLFIGLLQAFGTFGVGKALMYPLTGVCIAIWGSFSVVVLICSAIQDQRLPSDQKLIGMFISLVSCASVGLLA
jgi:drug/metabolite transporter (DMT)-like permease